jgi:hypothetical protein
MCPSLTCRRILAVPSASRGKNVRCKNCGATLRVPDRSAAPASTPATAPADGNAPGKGEPDKQAKPAA